MGWSPAVIWLAVALLLGVAELASGALVLLALAVSAAIAAAVAAFGLGLSWQLLALGLAAGLLVPLAIWRIRPCFSPKGVRYGTTGTGAERGQVFRTERRDFDGAVGLKLNGDFYRARLAGPLGASPEVGDVVRFERFDGTTAVVSLAPEVSINHTGG